MKSCTLKDAIAKAETCNDFLQVASLAARMANQSV